MKAIVHEEYGSPDVMQLKEVKKPTPKDDEVLVKIHTVSINAADWHLLTADIFLVRLMGEGFFKPNNKILGADIAGRVEAVGKKVTRFQPGDYVFGDIASCGFGGLAEYACARENLLVLKPASISFEDAAAMPMAGVTALQGLRDKGHIQSGQRVLINGASGGVGTFAVQLAKAFGAEVTAVCSTSKMDTMRALGANHVIDYTQENFTQSGKFYDLILAANGYHPISAYKRALSPNGRYVMTGGSGAQLFQAIALGSLYSLNGKKMVALAAKQNYEDLETLKELYEAGKIKPIIDRRYPLSEAAEAFRYFGEGHTKGKVIITVA